MIVILSPAKTLNFSAARSKLASHPRLLEHTHRLASVRKPRPRDFHVQTTTTTSHNIVPSRMAHRDFIFGRDDVPQCVCVFVYCLVYLGGGQLQWALLATHRASFQCLCAVRRS